MLPKLSAEPVCKADMQIYYSVIGSNQVITDFNLDQIVKIDHETGQVEILHATDIRLINQQV